MSAALTTTTSAPVGAEFTGRARQFRAAIDAEDTRLPGIVTTIMRPLKARFERGKRTHREARLIDAARAWRRQIPTQGRLDLKVERDKATLKIREWRASAGTFRFCAWPDKSREPDIGIVSLMLDIGPGHLECRTEELASISLHAIARWQQRSFNVVDDALRADLLAIAREHTGILAGEWSDFRIAAAQGEWVGGVVRMERDGVSKPLLSIRSFLN